MEDADERGGLQFLEIRSSLPDELFMHGDKLSVAHRLEVRVPYLDQDTVEYVERMSTSFKALRGSLKWVRWQVNKRFLPPEIIKRRKLGFAAPVDEWLLHYVP